MSNIKGFTLFELIFTLALLVITLSLGVPAFSHWIQRSHITDLQQTLFHSIHYTRTQATQLKSFVTLCPGINSCDENWGSDLQIFTDTNGNGQKDSSETTLKQINLGSLGRHLDWRSFRRQPYLQFNAQGITTALNGTFHFCPEAPLQNHQFTIVISRTGRVRVGENPSCQ
jgi:type IV fimbrial biogenesis protein FimT